MPPEYQAPEVLNQAAPVQNTWYTIGAVMLNAFVYKGAVHVAVANETLEVQAIVDGETIQAVGVACTAGLPYSMHLEPEPILRNDRISLAQLTGTGLPRYGSMLIMGRSVEIQVRKTTALGAGNLTGVILWGQYSERAL